MSIDRTSFESLYNGQPRWEIGRPQKALLDVADHITGAILDSGCGTGENALFFANRGPLVTGIDFLEEPINIAKQKAVERRLTANFLVMDALTLANLPERFDTVIDSGLFHVFSDDDRQRYVDALASVLKPGGRFYLLCFSDDDQAQLVHVEYQKMKFERVLPRDGKFRASSVQGTKFAPIQMIQVLKTVGRRHGL